MGCYRTKFHCTLHELFPPPQLRDTQPTQTILPPKAFKQHRATLQSGYQEVFFIQFHLGAELNRHNGKLPCVFLSHLFWFSIRQKNIWNVHQRARKFRNQIGKSQRSQKTTHISNLEWQFQLRNPANILRRPIHCFWWRPVRDFPTQKQFRPPLRTCLNWYVCSVNQSNL